MKQSLYHTNLGSIAYGEALAIQKLTHQSILEKNASDHLLLCEHPHVYTFGKHADRNNLLILPEFLKQIKAEVFETDRGGDITYHGPGQLVGYPIIHLARRGMGVRRYVDLLEEILIASLQVCSIKAYRIEGLTGIWVGKEQEIKRKIGAIGIRIKNGVSMHGFALNIQTDLSYFDHIVPCGIKDKEVTSMAAEGVDISIDSFSETFKSLFTQALD